ncbi:hypothetical protein DPEC_G00037320 [Dallia pectoralis]|uniref:Uncharacterized protein n=1 Tax=Dallia pectoralis TaxID=75939 RepID=A0ACC2HDW3_DALPE|nr:hypothetical protein DPEC_G00037320 [Dallia pectoralis]
MELKIQRLRHMLRQMEEEKVAESERAQVAMENLKAEFRKKIQLEMRRRKELEIEKETAKGELEIQHTLRKTLEKEYEEKMNEALFEIKNTKTEMEDFKNQIKREVKVRTKEDKEIVEYWTPSVVEPVHRLIQCKPRPKADIEPDSCLSSDLIQVQRPEPEIAPEWEVLDIEMDENECVDVDVTYNSTSINHSETQEAKQRLFNQEEEVEGKALEEARDDQPRMHLATLKSNQWVTRMKGETVNFQADSDLQQEAVDQPQKNKSKRRQLIGWVNDMVKDKYQQKIEHTYHNEEHKGDKEVYSWCLGDYVAVNRKEWEAKKRSKLLKGEALRQKAECRWQDWEKSKAEKKQMKKIQKRPKAGEDGKNIQSAADIVSLKSDWVFLKTV